MQATEAALTSALSHLECGWCEATWPADQLMNLCPDCERPLLARYDMAQAGKTLKPASLRNRPSNLWRYAEVLPVRQPAMRKTLGEGCTPLIPLPRLGAALGLTSDFMPRTRPPTRPTPSRRAAWWWPSIALWSWGPRQSLFLLPATQAAPWLRRRRVMDFPRTFSYPGTFPRPSSPKCMRWAQKSRWWTA